jgi:hypothetical protein
MAFRFKNESRDIHRVEPKDTFLSKNDEPHFVAFVDDGDRCKPVALVNLATGRVLYFATRSPLVEYLRENSFRKKDFTLTIE